MSVTPAASSMDAQSVDATLNQVDQLIAQGNARMALMIVVKLMWTVAKVQEQNETLKYAKDADTASKLSKLNELLKTTSSYYMPDQDDDSPQATFELLDSSADVGLYAKDGKGLALVDWALQYTDLGKNGQISDGQIAPYLQSLGIDFDPTKISLYQFANVTLPSFIDSLSQKAQEQSTNLETYQQSSDTWLSTLTNVLQRMFDMLKAINQKLS